MFVILSSSTTTYNLPLSLSSFIPYLMTLFATIIGWLLNYLSSNKGGIKISIEENIFYKSKKEQLVYFIKVYIYNNSTKPKHIRNIEVRFYKKNKSLFYDHPRDKGDSLEPIGIFNKNKIGMISFNPYEAKSITLCNILGKEDINKLLDADRIMLVYKKEKGREKQKIINNKFIYNSIELYGKSKFFD